MSELGGGIKFHRSELYSMEGDEESKGKTVVLKLVDGPVALAVVVGFSDVHRLRNTN